MAKDKSPSCQKKIKSNIKDKEEKQKLSKKLPNKKVIVDQAYQEP